MLIFDFVAGWLGAVLLLSIRIGALFVMSPLLSPIAGLTHLRVFWVLGLSVALVSGLNLGISQNISAAGLLLAALAELFNGALLAFAVFAAFAAIHMAAQWLDMQMGLGMAAVFDPITRSQSPALVGGFNLLGVIVFLGIGGHHVLLKGVAYSLEQVPLGTAIVVAPDMLVRHGGLMMSLALLLIAPVFLGLLLIDLGIAVISRMLPQMNVLVFGMPIKIMTGMGLLALSAPMMEHPLGRIFDSIFRFWDLVLR